ncbi:hypothetical protein Glove_74g255 [Diversispora epigaea]|uniref:Uncharacterized protein n=1 Tax=Diversispora epigaea TaxID=1348612 RepID=A0A397JI29_9GLOM|nr:hypothetical protein Glove_74g255 [Diversispora epigaea]
MALSRNFLKFNNLEKENATKLVNTIWQCLNNLIDPPLKENEKEKDSEQQDSFEGELFLDENTLKERLEYLKEIVTKKRHELGLSDSELKQAFHNARSKRRRHISTNEVFVEILNQFNFFISGFNLNFKTPKMINDDYDNDNDKFGVIKNLLINLLIPKLLTLVSGCGCPYYFTGTILLLLRNLYVTTKVSLKSFEALKSSNKKFDEILAGHKNHFMMHLNNLECNINEIMINDDYDNDNDKFGVIKNLLINLLIPKLLTLVSGCGCPYYFTGTILLLLRNLYVTTKVSLKSFEALKSSNKKFDEILAGHKNHFMMHLNNLECNINEIVELLQLSDQNFSNWQYEKFQKRLGMFLETTQNLMKLLKLITVQCDDEASFLEDNKSTLEKVGIGAAIVGGLAFLIGTAIAADTNSSEKTRKYGKIAAAAGGVTLAATGLSHLCVHNKIEKSIGCQKRMIQQLTKIHENLFQWDLRSNQIKEKDYDEMDFHTRKQLVLIFQGYEQMNEKFKDYFNTLRSNYLIQYE